MPARKISALSAATTLTGAELLPVVQGGATKRVSADLLLGLPAFNVKKYGAAGNGTTDDTAAIDLAIAAMTAAGGGRLHFPKGAYLTSGGHNATVPFSVTGDGAGNFYGTAGVSRILCPSPTAVVFTCTAGVGLFADLGFVNTSPTTPTAGAAVLTDGASIAQRVDFSRVTSHGFYDGIDIKVGNAWSMDGCMVTDPVRYGLRIRNTVNEDAGDWSITNSSVWSYTRNAVAGVQIDSGGAGKVTNLKVNGGPNGAGGVFAFDNALVADRHGATSILNIANSSFENYGEGGAGVLLSNWDLVTVALCEFGIYSGSTAYGIKATNCGQFREVGNSFASVLAGREVSLTTCPLARTDYPVTRLVGGAGEPAFANSWGNLSSGYQEAGFWLDAGGYVHLVGEVTGGAFGTVVFTLPVGYRPTRHQIFPIWASGAAVLIVQTDGTVTVSQSATYPANPASVSLDVPPWKTWA